MEHVLAVIPARGGSKRIPGKNRLRLGGRTLVEIAAAAAIDADISDVVVSTDEPTIAGGLAMVKRPAALCGDTADIASATRHALESVEGATDRRFAYIVTLQPTIPLRPPGMIRAMIRAMKETGAVSALTVAPVAPWMWRIDHQAATAANEWSPGPYIRSQDIRHQWAQEINSVQIARRDVVLSGERWALPLLLAELPAWATIDIDTPADLAEARRLWPQLSEMMRDKVNLKTHLISRIDRITTREVLST